MVWLELNLLTELRITSSLIGGKKNVALSEAALVVTVTVPFCKQNVDNEFFKH